MTVNAAHPLLLSCRSLGAAFDAQDAAIADQLDITRNELRLLNALEDGPRTQVDVARHLRVSRAAVTVIVDGLERRALVTRTPDASDRRVKLVALTPTYWRQLAQHYAPIGERVLAWASTLNADESARLAANLSSLAEVISPARS